jgi:hypothetical protein
VTIRLWDGLDDLNVLVGADFPDADEDGLWRCSAAWSRAAAGLRELTPGATAAGVQVLEALGGDAGAAFAAAWQGFVARDDGFVDRLADACDELARACDTVAVEVEYAKIQYIAALVILGATIAALVATIWAGGVSAAGIPVAIAAAQVSIRLVMMRLLTAIVLGAAVNLAVDAVAQSIQFAGGHRDAWDWSKTARAAEDGAIFGAVGGGVFLAGGRLAPGFAQSPVGLIAGGALTGGLGGLAAPLAHGEVPTAQDFLTAMTSGVVGGLGPDLAHGRVPGPDLSALGALGPGPSPAASLDSGPAGTGPAPTGAGTDRTVISSGIEPEPGHGTGRSPSDAPHLAGSVIADPAPTRRSEPAAVTGGPALAPGDRTGSPRYDPPGAPVGPLSTAIPGPSGLVSAHPLAGAGTAPLVPAQPASPAGPGTVAGPGTGPTGPAATPPGPAGAVGVAPAAGIATGPPPAAPPAVAATSATGTSAIGNSATGNSATGTSVAGPAATGSVAAGSGTVAPAGVLITAITSSAGDAPGAAGNQRPGPVDPGADASVVPDPDAGWELSDAEARDLVRANAFRTDAGLGFYALDDEIRDFARAVHPAGGFVTLDLHGSPKGFQIDDHLVSPEQFAAALRALIADGTLQLPDGHGIKLLSCDTATGGLDSPAARLARELGVVVIAPDLPVWTTMDGDEVVASPVLVEGNFLPADPPDGSWHRFQPDGRTDAVGQQVIPAATDGAGSDVRGLHDHAPRGPDTEAASDHVVGDGGSARLVGAEHAFVDDRKVTGYALEPDHPVGGNKAAVFRSVLGFDQSNAADLLAQIRAGITSQPPVTGVADRYGQRYTVDIPVTGPRGSAIVRTGWIYDPGASAPRLTTLFVR